MDIAVLSQIEVELTGHNASRVDVLVLDQNNYTKYVDGKEFDFYGERSALAVSNISLNFTVLSGTVYVIVDNSNRPVTAGA